MSDSSQKNISDLSETDRVWNPITRQAQSIRRMTRGPEKIPMLRLGIKQKELLVTVGHPFLTKSGLKAANELKLGELIKETGGGWEELSSIEPVPVPEVLPIVWNLELVGTSDEDHYVEANGIIAGDLYLQNELLKKKSK